MPETEPLTCPTADSLRLAWYAACHRRLSLPASANSEVRHLAEEAVMVTKTAYIAHRRKCSYCHSHFLDINRNLVEAAKTMMGTIDEKSNER
jgi:hypothetical protein